jgi:hypothetical protein
MFHGMLTASPNPLVAVWLGECAKFFHPDDLVAREFTDVDDWLKNTQPGVVWIVKINTLSSESSSFSRLCAVQPDIRLLSTWLDEGHIFGRASDGSGNTGSRRHDTLMKFTSRTEFNCLMSGTLFPLGPIDDAESVFYTVGGSPSEPSRNNKRSWDPRIAQDLQTVLRNLSRRPTVEHPKPQPEPAIIALRAVMALFTIRRTPDSKWPGDDGTARWIVSRDYVRSEPVTISLAKLESTEGYIAQAEQVFVKERSGQERETQAQVIKRADYQKFYVLAPLYAHLLHRNLHNDSRATERYIEESYSMMKQTTRMKVLCAWVLRQKEKGRRFVLVSERRFPLLLAGYVLPPLAASTDVCRSARGWD